MSDNILIDVSTTIENVNVEVVEASAASIGIEYFYPQGPAGNSLWGTISGTLSAQSDLWRYLSADSDGQTLTYTPSSYFLSISNGNTVNLSSINSTFASNSGKYEIVYSNVQSNSANWNQAYNVATTYQNASSSFLQTFTYTQSSDNLTISNGNTTSLNAYQQKSNVTTPTWTTNIQLSGTHRNQRFIVNTYGTSVTATLPTLTTGAQINDIINIEGSVLINGSIFISAFTGQNRTIVRAGQNYTYRFYTGGFGDNWYLEPMVTSHNETHSSTGSDPITPQSILALPVSGGTVTGNLTIQGNLTATGIIYTNSDIEITNFTKGIILRSPNGNRWRTTITDSGTLSSVQL